MAVIWHAQPCLAHRNTREKQQAYSGPFPVMSFVSLSLNPTTEESDGPTLRTLTVNAFSLNSAISVPNYKLQLVLNFIFKYVLLVTKMWPKPLKMDWKIMCEQKWLNPWAHPSVSPWTRAVPLWRRRRAGSMRMRVRLMSRVRLSAPYFRLGWRVSLGRRDGVACWASFGSGAERGGLNTGKGSPFSIFFFLITILKFSNLDLNLNLNPSEN